MSTKPRAWASERVCVFNNSYSADGALLMRLQKPWTVSARNGAYAYPLPSFATFAQAIRYADKIARGARK